jgi:hypothetical protein
LIFALISVCDSAPCSNVATYWCLSSQAFPFAE